MTRTLWPGRSPDESESISRCIGAPRLIPNRVAWQGKHKVRVHLVEFVRQPFSSLDPGVSAEVNDADRVHWHHPAEGAAVRAESGERDDGVSSVANEQGTAERGLECA